MDIEIGSTQLVIIMSVIMACLIALSLWGVRAKLEKVTNKIVGRLKNTISALEDDNKKMKPPYEKFRKISSQLMTMRTLFHGSLANPCRDFVADNLWLLMPDYVPTGEPVFVDRQLQTIFPLLFDGQPFEANSQFPVDPAWRPDICGWFTAAGRFECTNKQQKKLVIIEFKNPDTGIIGFPAIEQAYGYAYAIVLAARGALAGQTVECLVIGGSVSPSARGMHMMPGDTELGEIRITPLTYDDLIARAEIMADYFLVREYEPAAQGVAIRPSLLTASLQPDHGARQSLNIST